jgi:hypothetical protein
MQSTQPLNSAQTQQEADPHDVFAIESILAGRADHRAPPLAHDPASQPAAPPVHVAPEISVAAVVTPQVEPEFRAIDVRNIGVEGVRSDEIKVDDLMAPGDRPVSRSGKKVVMALLGLSGAIAAAAWQHYGDQAKAMAVSWAPQSVLTALSSSETPPAAEPAGAATAQAAAADQAATTEQPAPQAAAPATSEQAATPAATAPLAAAPSAESSQLQEMAQDLAAMTKQVEELKASIAQLRTSHAQMAREVAKSAEAKAPDARPSEQAPRPRVAAAPPPRATAPPAPRRPPPAHTAYIPPVQPLPPPAAPVQAQPAPPQMADDGQPVVRPPMPVR